MSLRVHAGKAAIHRSVAPVRVCLAFVRSGVKEVGEAWNGGVGAGAAPRPTRPLKIILRVALPELDTIAGMALDVTSSKVSFGKSWGPPGHVSPFARRLHAPS